MTGSKQPDTLKGEAKSTLQSWIENQRARLRDWHQGDGEGGVSGGDDAPSLLAADARGVDSGWSGEAAVKTLANSYRSSASYQEHFGEGVTELAMLLRRKTTALQKLKQLEVSAMDFNGRKTERVPVKRPEPPRKKTNWDFLLEEGCWLANDFHGERVWKIVSARELAKDCKRAVRRRKQRPRSARAKRSGASTCSSEAGTSSSGQTAVPSKQGERSLSDLVSLGRSICYAIFGKSQYSHLSQIQSLRQQVTEGETLSQKVPAFNCCRSAFLEVLNRLPSNVRGLLRPYQVAGLFWWWNMVHNDLGTVFNDERGLGKKVMTICGASMLLNHTTRRAGNSNSGTALILCADSLISNWHRQLSCWAPQFSVTTTLGKRMREFDFVLTSPRRLRESIGYSVAEDVNAMDGNSGSKKCSSVPEVFRQWEIIVLDMTMCTWKSEDVTLGWSTIRSASGRVKDESKYQSELVPPWKFLSNVHYRHRVCLCDRWPSTTVAGHIMNFILPRADSAEETEESIQRSLEPFVLRRRISDDGIAPQLPLPYTQTVLCSASSLQRASTGTLLSRVSNVKLSLSDGNASNAAKFQKLFQWMAAAHAVAQHPSLLSTYYDEESLAAGKFSSVFGGINERVLRTQILDVTLSLCPETFISSQWNSPKEEIPCGFSTHVKSLRCILLQPDWGIATLAREGRYAACVEQFADVQHAMDSASKARCAALSSHVAKLARSARHFEWIDKRPSEVFAADMYGKSLLRLDGLVNCEFSRLSFEGVPAWQVPGRERQRPYPLVNPSPAVVDYTGSSGKFRALHSILSEARSHGEKVLLLTSLPHLATMTKHFFSACGICSTLLNESRGDQLLPMLSETATSEFDTSSRARAGILAVPGYGESSCGSANFAPRNHAVTAPLDGTSRYGDIHFGANLPCSVTVVVLLDVFLMPSAANTLANMLDKLSAAKTIRIIQLATLGTIEEACLNVWSGASSDNAIVQASAGEGHPGLKVHTGDTGGLHSLQLTYAEREEESLSNDTASNEYRKALGDATVSRREARLRAIQNITNDTDKWSISPEQDRNNVVSHGLLAYTNGITPSLLSCIDVGSLVAGRVYARGAEGSSNAAEGLTSALQSIVWNGKGATVEQSRLFFENCLVEAFVPPEYRVSLQSEEVGELLQRSIESLQWASEQTSFRLRGDCDDLKKRPAPCQSEQESLPLTYSVSHSRLGGDTALLSAASLAQPPQNSLISSAVDSFRINAFQKNVVEKLASVVEALSIMQDEGIIHFSRLFGPPNPDAKAVHSSCTVADPSRADAVRRKCDALRKRVGVFQHATRLKAGQRNALPAIGKGSGAALTMVHSLSQCHRIPADAIADLTSLQKETSSEQMGKGAANGSSMASAPYGIADGCNSDFSVSRMWCSHLLAPPEPASKVPRRVVQAIQTKEQYLQTAKQASLSVITRCVSLSSASQIVRRVRSGGHRSGLGIPPESKLSFVMRSLSALGGISFSSLLFTHVSQTKIESSSSSTTAYNSKKLRLLPSAVNRALFPIGLASQCAQGCSTTAGAAPLICGSHGASRALARAYALYFVSSVDENQPYALPSGVREGWEPWEDYLILSLVRDFGSNWDFVNTAFQNHPFVRTASAEAASSQLKVAQRVELGSGRSAGYVSTAFDLGRNRSRGMHNIYYRHRRLVASHLPHGLWGMLSKRDAFLTTTGRAYEMYPPDLESLGKTPKYYIDEVNTPKERFSGSVFFRPSPLTQQVISSAVRTSLESRIETPEAVPEEALVSFRTKAHTLAAQWEEDVQRANGRGGDQKRSSPSCIYEEIIRPHNYSEKMRSHREPTPFKQTPSSVHAARNSARSRGQPTSGASRSGSVASQKYAGGSSYLNSQVAAGSQLQTSTQPARVNLKLGPDTSHGYGSAQSRQARTPHVSLNIPGSGPTPNLSSMKDSFAGASHPAAFSAPSVTATIDNNSSSSALAPNGVEKKVSRSGSGGSAIASRKRAAPEASSQPPASSPAGAVKKRKQSRSKSSNRGRTGSRDSGQSTRGFPVGGPQPPFTPTETVTAAQESASQSMPNAGEDYQQWLANLLEDKDLAPKIIEASNDPTLDDDAKAARIEQVVKEYTQNR
eukprot:gb/GECG01015024.1/.p1 GENE.gb/GECG01015024.1/~~gb/GECG01015024.1/.p1  ORF type:complete len:2104 (+),score=211.39 gb/GECG01015024.1/:1-6312(+)